MVTAVLRGLAAAALAVLPTTVSTPAQAAETLPLTEAVASLPVATESRDGYGRDKFRHWNGAFQRARRARRPGPRARGV